MVRTFNAIFPPRHPRREGRPEALVVGTIRRILGSMDFLRSGHFLDVFKPIPEIRLRKSKYFTKPFTQIHDQFLKPKLTLKWRFLCAKSPQTGAHAAPTLFQNRFESWRRTAILPKMKTNTTGQLQDGARCKVIGGTHAGKTGTVHDIKTGKTGHVSITVKQPNGVRFKTLAKNVVVLADTA
jgi:hypothetical protein